MNPVTDDTAAIAAVLSPHHVRALQDIKFRLAIFGWDSYSLTESDLVRLGLLNGQWYGGLSFPAQPMWRLTTLGERVLAHLDARLSASASVSGDKP